MKTLLMSFLTCATVIAASCGSDSGQAATACGPATGTIERVVDGDTVVLVGGQKVRYLGIDTPETDACYGSEATAANRELVLGKEVALEYDVECHDNYNRLLAHVSINGGSVNMTLLEQGYACQMVISPNLLYRDVYANAVQIARAYGRGVWSACAPVPCL